jgi:hypothetical protein
MEEATQRWIRDPRRVTHRLAGYQFGEVASAAAIIDVLMAERRAVRLFWETRSLWFALKNVETVFPRARSEGEGRLVAAACMVIDRDLAVTPQADERGSCRKLIATFDQRHPEMKRARWLDGLASEYEGIRATMRSSTQRTVRMNELVDRVIASPDAVTSPTEPGIWFRGGFPGQRIAALALLIASPRAGGVDVLDEAIGRALTPFEQYTALRALSANLDALDVAQLRGLVATIEAVRHPASEAKVQFTRDDPSRWDLSGHILRRAYSRLTASERAAAATPQPSDPPKPAPSAISAARVRMEETYPKSLRRAARDLHAELRLWLAWPAVPLEPGDVVQPTGAGLVKITSLRALGIPCDVKEAAMVEYETTSAAQVSRNPKGRSRLVFQRAGAYYLRAAAALPRHVADLEDVQMRIEKAAEDGSWNLDWVALTTVVTPRTYTLVVAQSSDASAVVNLEEGEILESAGAQVSFRSDGEVALFFLGHGMQRRILRAPRFALAE